MSRAGRRSRPLAWLQLSTTTRCRRPRARNSLNTRGRDASCKGGRASSELLAGPTREGPPSLGLLADPHPRTPPSLAAARGRHLGHGVGGGVHELREVHGALALVLRHMDGLDGREAWVGVSEVLEPQSPPHQAHAGALHEHLRAVCVRPRTHRLPPHPQAPGSYLVLQQDDQLGAQDQALKPRGLRTETTVCGGLRPRPFPPQGHPAATPDICRGHTPLCAPSTRGPQLWALALLQAVRLHALITAQSPGAAAGRDPEPGRDSKRPW